MYTLKNHRLQGSVLVESSRKPERVQSKWRYDMKKSFSYIITIIMTILLLTGCGAHSVSFGNWNKTREDKQVNVVEEMEDYLVEKYDLGYFYDDIEVLGVVYAGWNQSYDVMNCCLKGEDEKRTAFQIKRYQDNEGNVTYTENYGCLSIRDEYEAYIKEFISDEIKECKVFVSWNQSTLSDNMTVDTPFEEVLKTESLNSIVWIMIPCNESDSDELEASVKDIVANWEAKEEQQVIFRFILLKEDAYNDVTTENRYEYSKDEYKYADIMESAN